MDTLSEIEMQFQASNGSLIHTTLVNLLFLNDRSDWAKGEWDNEPFDGAEWTDTLTGLKCRMKRNNMGAWCGYVIIPDDHPWAGKGFMEIDSVRNLSFSVRVSGQWLIGFDCAYSDDITPTGRTRQMKGATYKDIKWVIEECTDLAREAWNVHLKDMDERNELACFKADLDKAIDTLEDKSDPMLEKVLYTLHKAKHLI